MSFSILVNYTEENWKKYTSNSFNVPVFALCYSPYCPHCVGLPEGFDRFSKGLGNRTDIVLMIINCYGGYGCARLHIRGTPHIALVIGKEWKYWPATGERGAEGWDRWLNQTLAPTLRKIETDEELKEAQQEPKDGGTTFLLEVPSENDPSIAILRNHTKLFRHYNDTFVYRVRKELDAAELIAYRKPGCPISYYGKMEEMYSFLLRNRFGLYHRYQYTEYLSIPQNERSAVLVVEKDLSKSQHHFLGLLGTNECSDINYGWASVEDNEKFSRLPGSITEVPYLYVKGRNGENHVWFKSLKKAKTELIPKVLESKNIRQKKQNIEENENKVMKKQSIKKYSAYTMSIVGGVITYCIVINIHKYLKTRNAKAL